MSLAGATEGNPHGKICRLESSQPRVSRVEPSGRLLSGGLYYQLQAMVFGSRGGIHERPAMFRLAPVPDSPWLWRGCGITADRGPPAEATDPSRQSVSMGGLRIHPAVFLRAVLLGLVLLVYLGDEFQGVARRVGLGGLALMRQEYDCLNQALEFPDQPIDPEPSPASEDSNGTPGIAFADGGGAGLGRRSTFAPLPLRVSLVGLAMEVLGRAAPSLAVYNLRAYALGDPELAPRVAVAVPTCRSPSGWPGAGRGGRRPIPLSWACHATRGTPAMLRLAAGIRAADRRRRSSCWAGPTRPSGPGSCWRGTPAVDGVVAGEEEAFRLLLRRLAGLDPAPWEDTPGLVVRDGAGYRALPPLNPLAMNRVPVLLGGPRLPPPPPRPAGREPAVPATAAPTARTAPSRPAGGCGLSATRRPCPARVRRCRRRKIWLLDPGLNQEPRRFRAGPPPGCVEQPDAGRGGAESPLQPPDLAPLAGRATSSFFGLQSVSPRALRQAGRSARLAAFQG